MKHLLITGGAGFIGANFVHYWLRQHAEDRVVVLDALTYAGNRANLASVQDNSRLRLIVGEIGDAALLSHLFAEEGIDCVVHFAAESHVDRSITGPDEFIRTNVLGTHALLKAARAAWSNDGQWRDGVRFHHVSTDEVYGSLRPADPAFAETTAYSPNSPYSASKAASDHLVRAYHHTYGLPVTTSNCSNNYGPYHFPEKLIPLMLVNALDGKPLPVYGQGENVRDWLFVEDHCRAIDAILQRGRVGETYNVGGRNEWRNIDIVRHLCALLDRRFAQQADLRARFPNCPAARGEPVERLIAFVTDRLGHDWRYAIDATKIQRELGFAPAESFETGIEKTVDWYLANEGWWRNVLSGEYRRA
ncbi:dTDP-glucose 4,6-dehydratase [Steroidobacter sp.]|uniref:dTDP-glucose 4,6-dehydratase n=1 Tax=Steroidobacter sp. TaxID=1978227 RepID=UPI001A638D56|nr:dTDP-glucose 4,6-dehydratase [Steroidobacter sp.]MBL8271014.1 dTDP-glucose 4,6-dehydratase [Steroidobacter sp.]